MEIAHLSTTDSFLLVSELEVGRLFLPCRLVPNQVEINVLANGPIITLLINELGATGLT